MVTKTKVIETIKTNHSIWFETSLSFHCDRDSLRLGSSTAIETETYQDLEIPQTRDRDFARRQSITVLRPRLIEIGLTCRDRDFFESLVDLWSILGLKFYSAQVRGQTKNKYFFLLKTYQGQVNLHHFIISHYITTIALSHKACLTRFFDNPFFRRNFSVFYPAFFFFP